MNLRDWMDLHSRAGPVELRRLVEELEGVWGIPVGVINGYRVVGAADVERAHRDELGRDVDDEAGAG